jgi:putative flippase GtrA/glycosyltransferase involved in cell wall biosynthesis
MTAVLDYPTGPPRGGTEADGGGSNRRTTAVEVVVPVHNEEADLRPSVLRLHAYLSTSFPFTWRITIADNASTDTTPQVAKQLADALPGVRVARLDQKGRGRALRHTWLDTDATVVAYMDVDLSTDLAALLPLVAPLLSGHSDVAIGSRLARSSRVIRGTKREVISRCYNLLLRTTLRTRFSDAQCGFKAMRADRARVLLPHVRDTGWFWDTELLVLAERAGLRIHEVPVDWVDDPDSRVDIVATALADLRGIARLAAGLLSRRLPMAQLRAAFRDPEAGVRVSGGVPRGLPRQLGRFAVIGVLSTLAYSLLYFLLRPAAGAQPANALALLITAIANTAANRRYTFATRGRRDMLRHQLEGLLVFALGLSVTSGSLAVLHALSNTPATSVELIVLAAANLTATVLRFVMLKAWVFHPARRRRGAHRLEVAIDEGSAR